MFLFRYKSKGTEREYKIYQRNEPGCPQYIDFLGLSAPGVTPAKIYRAGHVGTVDGYVVPVLRVFRDSNVFQIVSKKKTNYLWSLVKKGIQLPFFDPPHGYTQQFKPETERNAQGKRRKITDQEIAFCWSFARTWNIKQAVKDSGFPYVDSDKHLLAFGNFLLSRPQLREFVMHSFRKQLEIAHRDETDFVIRRLEMTFEATDEILDLCRKTLAMQVSQKSNIAVKSVDIEPIMKLVEFNRDTAIKIAEWLGYDIKEEQQAASNQLNNQNNFFMASTQSLPNGNDNHNLIDNVQPNGIGAPAAEVVGTESNLMNTKIKNAHPETFNVPVGVSESSEAFKNPEVVLPNQEETTDAESNENEDDADSREEQPVYADTPTTEPAKSAKYAPIPNAAF